MTAKSLEEFLAAKKTFDKAKWTHVGMGPEGSVHQGKYMINDHEYPQLLKLIMQHCFTNEKPYNLLERHKDVGPVLIDLDFRYDVAEEDMPPEGNSVKEKKARAEAIRKLCYRRYTSEMIDSFIYGYGNIIDKYYDISQFETLTFYIMEKPAPTFDYKQKKVKDGIHIVISDLITSPEIQKAFRRAAIDEHIIQEAFGKTELANSEDDIFDIRVIKSNNWFMYGASKPDQPAYLLKRKIVLVNGGLEETDDFEEPEDLLKLLSLRYEKTETTLVLKEETSDEWTNLMNKANGVILKADLLEDTTTPIVKIVKRRLPGASITPPDCEALGFDIGGAEHGTFDSILNPYANKEEINTVMRLVTECLGIERANSYSQWMDVGFCLHNICASVLFDSWVEFSQKSPKFDAASLAKMRTEWSRMTNKGLKLGSLHMWAKSDNPEAYEKIMADDIIREIQRTLECTHTAIARITYRVFQHKFCCASFEKKSWYEFRDNRWYPLDGGITLRKALTGEIKQLYLEAEARIIQKQKGVDAESEENKKLAAQKKILAEINKKLGMHGFKDDVMRECQEIFHRDGFLKELNTNPYLLVCKNGVLELRGHKKIGGKDCIGVVFRAGIPDDMMSYTTNLNFVKYDPEHPYFLAVMDFFTKLFPHKEEREYVLTLLASCLEGTNREQNFYIMTGVGSNGKSQLVRFLNKTLNDFTGSLSTTSITRKRPDSSSANPDLIGIKGKRFISMQEPDPRESINSSIMKQLSGEDDVAARALYGDQEYITIMGKIFMACNDMPTIPTTDWGTWRRIRVLRFRSRFCKDPNPDPAAYEYLVDKTLNDKMMEWREAFLSILVFYYETQYLRYGLQEPESVKEDSRRYQEENDQFANFLKETVEPSTSSECKGVRLADIWSRYSEWAAGQKGYRKMKQAEFRIRMKAQYGDVDPTTSCFRGIRLMIPGEIGTEDLSGSVV